MGKHSKKYNGESNSQETEDRNSAVERIERDGSEHAGGVGQEDIELTTEEVLNQETVDNIREMRFQDSRTADTADLDDGDDVDDTMDEETEAAARTIVSNVVRESIKSVEQGSILQDTAKKLVKNTMMHATRVVSGKCVGFSLMADQDTTDTTRDETPRQQSRKPIPSVRVTRPSFEIPAKKIKEVVHSYIAHITTACQHALTAPQCEVLHRPEQDDYVKSCVFNVLELNRKYIMDGVSNALPDSWDEWPVDVKPPSVQTMACRMVTDVTWHKNPLEKQRMRKHSVPHKDFAAAFVQRIILAAQVQLRREARMQAKPLTEQDAAMEKFAKSYVNRVLISSWRKMEGRGTSTCPLIWVETPGPVNIGLRSILRPSYTPSMTSDTESVASFADANCIQSTPRASAEDVVGPLKSQPVPTDKQKAWATSTPSERKSTGVSTATERELTGISMATDRRRTSHFKRMSSMLRRGPILYRPAPFCTYQKPTEYTNIPPLAQLPKLKGRVFPKKETVFGTETLRKIRNIPPPQFEDHEILHFSYYFVSKYYREKGNM